MIVKIVSSVTEQINDFLIKDLPKKVEFVVSKDGYNNKYRLCLTSTNYKNVNIRQSYHFNNILLDIYDWRDVILEFENKNNSYGEELQNIKDKLFNILFQYNKKYKNYDNFLENFNAFDDIPVTKKTSQQLLDSLNAYLLFVAMVAKQ